MAKLTVLFLGIFLLPFSAFGQMDTLHQLIHFETDRHELTTEHRQLLENFSTSALASAVQKNVG